MTKTKFNVILGVSTGILVGGVLAAVLLSNSETFAPTKGNAAGDIAKAGTLSKVLPAPIIEQENDPQTQSDTLRYEAMDSNGEQMEILIVKK